MRATTTRSSAIAASATVRMTWVLRSATCWARSAANWARSAACRTRWASSSAGSNVGDLCFGILDGFEIHAALRLCRQLPRRETGLIIRSGDGIVTQPAHGGDEHGFDSGGHRGVLDRGVARRMVEWDVFVDAIGEECLLPYRFRLAPPTNQNIDGKLPRYLYSPKSSLAVATGPSIARSAPKRSTKASPTVMVVVASLVTAGKL